MVERSALQPKRDPFEPEYMTEVIERFFGPITDHYFRPRLLRADRLPDEGPAILAGNHSGTAFPWDGLVLDSLLWRRSDKDPKRKWRSVFEKGLSFTWWMRPFGIDNFWRRGGGVDMTFDNFDRLLAGGERVVYYPEGVPGIGKGFQRRYQLQRFSCSFCIMAARHEAPVYPLYVVNAEWVIPFNFTIPALDKLVNRLLGIPFLPLPAGLLTPIFPFLFYLALPARMIFIIGEPIDVAKLVKETGEIDLQQPDLDLMRGVAEKVRRQMQERLDEYVARYGRRPYEGRSLRRRWREIRGRRSLMIPFTWVWTFLRYERDRDRKPAANRLTAVLRDWDLIFYYLPLGWPLLALARRFRKPPCGYRGLSRTERRRREGVFIWDLAQAPLRRDQPPAPEST